MGGLDQQCRTMRIENIKKNIYILYRATQSMIKLVKKRQRPEAKFKEFEPPLEFETRLKYG